MNNIPQNSQVSLLKGYWFIFKDGDQLIAANGSALTGQERIFVNGQLVSKKRTLNLTSIHSFSWEENVYDVKFYMPRLLAGKLDCSLTKNGVLIECLKTSYKFKSRIPKIISAAVVGGLLGFFTAYYYLPFWPLIILCGLIIIIVMNLETRNVVIRSET
jgi:hypothetical protein